MMHALQLVTPAYPGSREILPGQTYLLQGDPPKKSNQNKLMDYRVYRYDHHAWTPDDLPDTIVLLGGGGSGEFNAETLPGFAFVKIWLIFSFARTSYTTSESVPDS